MVAPRESESSNQPTAKLPASSRQPRSPPPSFGGGRLLVKGSHLLFNGDRMFVALAAEILWEVWTRSGAIPQRYILRRRIDPRMRPSEGGEVVSDLALRGPAVAGLSCRAETAREDRNWLHKH